MLGWNQKRAYRPIEQLNGSFTVTRAITFRQSDVTRALKAAKAAKVPVRRLEIEPSGKIIVVPDDGQDEPSHGDTNEWDDVK